MKNDKVCIDKRVSIIALVGILLVGTAALMAGIAHKSTSTNAKASIGGGIIANVCANAKDKMANAPLCYKFSGGTYSVSSSMVSLPRTNPKVTPLPKIPLSKYCNIYQAVDCGSSAPTPEQARTCTYNHQDANIYFKIDSHYCLRYKNTDANSSFMCPHDANGLLPGVNEATYDKVNCSSEQTSINPTSAADSVPLPTLALTQPSNPTGFPVGSDEAICNALGLEKCLINNYSKLCFPSLYKMNCIPVAKVTPANEEASLSNCTTLDTDEKCSQFRGFLFKCAWVSSTNKCIPDAGL